MKNRNDSAQMIGIFISVVGIIVLIVYYAFMHSGLGARPGLKLEELTLENISEDENGPKQLSRSVIARDEVREGDTVVVWKVHDIKEADDMVRMQFKGEAVITGHLHYLVKEGGDQICIQQMNDLSRSLIPTLKDDPTDLEVCFRNKATAQKFISPTDNGRMATLIIRDYEYLKNASGPAHSALLHLLINK